MSSEARQTKIDFPDNKKNKRDRPASLEDNIDATGDDKAESSSTPLDDAVSKIMSKLSSLESKISQVDSSTSLSVNRLTSIEAHITKFEDKLSGMDEKLQLVISKQAAQATFNETTLKRQEEFDGKLDIIKEKMKNLERENRTLQEDLRREALARDDLEAQARRLCLNVSGFAEVEGENPKAIMYAIYDFLGITQDRSTVDIAHRTFSKNLIFRFSTRTARDAVYSQRRKFENIKAEELGFKSSSKPGVYINESLSRERSMLMREARARQKIFNVGKEGDQRAKLHSDNGIIKMKVPGSPYVKIYCKNDIPIH